MKPYHILLVEDETALLEYYKSQLEQRGYRVTAAGTLKEAEAAIAAEFPHILLLDIMMPDGSGLEWCRSMRSYYYGPVLFLTNMGEISQMVMGLRSGGDDYIVKPCNIEELAARVEAHLRRMNWFCREIPKIGNQRLNLNTKTRRAYLDGREMVLKPKEYELLYIFLDNQGGYLTAKELYIKVWGMAPNGDIRTIWVHVSNLRKKLKNHEGEQVGDIEYERNKGYRLVMYDM